MESDAHTPLEDALAEYLLLVDSGRAVDRQAFIAAHPEVADQLQAYFADSDAMSNMLADTAAGGAAVPAEPKPAGPPTVEDYEILEELGRGGMGVVYKARHKRLGSLVAMKVMGETWAGDEQAVARFRREMLAVGKLQHPNIVRARDARQAGGTLILVTEFVDGLDLGEVVRRRGPLPVAAACGMIRQAARGLQCIHENGLVHRDIKPSNLILTESHEASGSSPEAAGSVVKILDLGLARFRQEHATITGGTVTGQALGTLDYMAPEQITDSRSVDIRADIYSLGCTLYKLLTGRAPFADEQHVQALAKMRAHLREQPPPVKHFRPDLPPALADLIDRMMAKEPAARLQSPEDVARQLEPFVPRRVSRTGSEPSAPATETPATAQIAWSTTYPSDLSGRPRTAAASARPAHGFGKFTKPILVGLGALAVVCLLAFLGWSLHGGPGDDRGGRAGQVNGLGTSDKMRTAPAIEDAPPSPQRRPDGPSAQTPASPPLQRPAPPLEKAQKPAGTPVAAPGPTPPGDLPAGSPPAIAPFDAAQAKQHQTAWAKYLGVPVELENSIGMNFTLIPPGEFDMGSTREDVAKLLKEAQATNQPWWYLERLPAEAPQHRVRIKRPFYLGLHEVTQAQYEGMGGNNPSESKDDPSLPVEMVTWDDASEFCRKLGALPAEQAMRAEYYLPTEAQWEYACRAGTATTWYSGESQAGLTDIMWYRANAAGKTHPVGQKRPNAWGLYDMLGNVREWCHDWLGDRYYGMSPLDDPAGLPEGLFRVNRGGCVVYDACNSRTSYRNKDLPNVRFGDQGFRVAKTVGWESASSSGAPRSQTSRPVAQARSKPQETAATTPGGQAREDEYELRREPPNDEAFRRVMTEAQQYLSRFQNRLAVFRVRLEDSGLEPECMLWSVGAIEAAKADKPSPATGQRYFERKG